MLRCQAERTAARIACKRLLHCGGNCRALLRRAYPKGLIKDGAFCERHRPISSRRNLARATLHDDFASTLARKLFNIPFRQQGNLSIMSSDQQLLSLMKTLGFSNDATRAALAAVESVEKQRLERIQAEADTSGLITAMQAASKSQRHAAQLHRLDGVIYSACGCKYRLPKDRVVNPIELDRALAGADTMTRMAVKGELHQLGMLAR